VGERKCGVVGTEGGVVYLFVLVIEEPEDQARLAHGRVPHEALAHHNNKKIIILQKISININKSSF
jgi:hypothetical protein